jgi:glycosyltransferase involved in cell wall biosynthesis
VARPSVSIIVPLFNKEEWVTQTLLSVYNQSYRDWECIIVNDGSTDKSLTKVNKFIEDHPANWQVITLANSGQTLARNFGIQLAKADLIAFLDADDLWHPKKLQVQVDLFKNNPELDLSLCPYVIFRENQVNFFRVVRILDPNKLAEGWLSLRGFGGLIESTGMIKKVALTKFGIFENSLSMSAGLELSIRVIRSGVCFVTSEPLVFYRLSESQFHKNQKLLINDMSLVSKIHARSPDALEKLEADFLAYLYWSENRGRGNWKFIKSVFSSILHLDIPKITTLYCLSSRNVIALFRGFGQKKKICAFLETQKVSALQI